MSSVSPAFDSALAQARLAMAAHLDARAVVQDAKSLRLDHLRAVLFKLLPDDSTLRQTILLRLPPEDDARLLLDYKHSVAMGGDGRTYRLEADTPTGRELLLESTSADEIAAEVLRREAVARVEEAVAADPNRRRTNGSGLVRDSWAQAIFLFLAGGVFGASALAALAIFLKKLNF